jgi:hypothetical protein
MIPAASEDAAAEIAGGVGIENGPRKTKSYITTPDSELVSDSPQRQNKSNPSFLQE